MNLSNLDAVGLVVVVVAVVLAAAASKGCCVSLGKSNDTSSKN